MVSRFSENSSIRDLKGKIRLKGKEFMNLQGIWRLKMRDQNIMGDGKLQTKLLTLRNYVIKADVKWGWPLESAWAFNRKCSLIAVMYMDLNTER